MRRTCLSVTSVSSVITSVCVCYYSGTRTRVGVQMPSRLHEVLKAGRVHQEATNRGGWSTPAYGTPEYYANQEELRREQAEYREELNRRNARGNEALVDLLNRMRMETLSIADQGSQGYMTVNLPQLAHVPEMTPGRYKFTPELAEALANSAAHIVSYKLNTTNTRDPYLMVNERMDHGQFTRPSPGHDYGWDEGFTRQGRGASSGRREAPRGLSREPSDDLFS